MLNGLSVQDIFIATGSDTGRYINSVYDCFSLWSTGVLPVILFKLMVLLALTLAAIKHTSANVSREDLQGEKSDEGVDRARRRERGEIWRTNLLLCREAYWGGNQTGWTMSAHTDALCLMSRWHFCSPSPPRWPAPAGREGERWRERAEGGGSAPAVPRPKSWDPDKVRGQGSPGGQPIRTGRIPFHSGMIRFIFIFFGDHLLCFLFRHPLFSIHLCPLSSHDLRPCYEVINALGRKVSRSFCWAV